MVVLKILLKQRNYHKSNRTIKSDFHIFLFPNLKLQLLLNKENEKDKQTPKSALFIIKKKSCSIVK